MLVCEIFTQCLCVHVYVCDLICLFVFVFAPSVFVLRDSEIFAQCVFESHSESSCVSLSLSHSVCLFLCTDSDGLRFVDVFRAREVAVPHIGWRLYANRGVVGT